MRKKELINENRFISEELHKLKNDNSLLKDELLAKNNEIKLLFEKIDELNLALEEKLMAEKALVEETVESDTEEMAENENITEQLKAENLLL